MGHAQVIRNAVQRARLETVEFTILQVFRA